MSDSLIAYTAQLRQRMEQNALNHARQKAIELKRQPVAQLDYTAIIHEWWSSMPPVVRQHAWSLEVIAAAAFVGQHRRPALRRVAETLLTLSWITRRDWTKAGRNRRLWCPPSSVSTTSKENSYAD
jgi:hypothetical protein